MAVHLAPMMTTMAASELCSSHHQAMCHQAGNFEAVCLAFLLFNRPTSKQSQGSESVKHSTQQGRELCACAPPVHCSSEAPHPVAA